MHTIQLVCLLQAEKLTGQKHIGQKAGQQSGNSRHGALLLCTQCQAVGSFEKIVFIIDADAMELS